MKLGKLLSVSVSLGGLAMTQTAHSAVVLNSAGGPAASYGQQYNYTTLGTAGYVFYGNSADGDEKLTLDGKFSALTNASGGITAPGSNSSGQISLVTFTDGTPSASATDATSFRYGVPDGSSFALGQSVSFTYNIGASHVLLSIYAVSYTAVGLMTLSQGATQLYADSPSGVSLPSSNGNHGSGVYTFDLTGSDPGDTVTLNYTSVQGFSGYVNVGIQGATATLIPEPTALFSLALGGLALLRRGSRGERARKE